MGLIDNRKVIFVTGGEGGYGNLGDEWLADSVRLRYKKIKLKYKVVFLMQRPKVDSAGFYYAKDYLEDFKKMGISNNKIAAVHFYGGGYLNNYWCHLKLWLYDYLIENKLSTRKVFFTGVGLGPLNFVNLKKVKKISKNTNLFGTRDNSFSNIIKSQKFTFDESIYSIKKLKTPKLNKNKILINFRMADHVGIDAKNIGKMLRSINEVAEKNNLNICYFPMIEQDGFSEKKEMINTLKSLNISYKKILERPANYRELLKLTSSSTLVVTTSYHATLASIYSGRPVVAVYGNKYYEIKFKTLQKILNSNLLKVVHVSKINKVIISEHLNSIDLTLFSKLEELRKCSDDAYDIYEKYLRISK